MEAKRISPRNNTFTLLIGTTLLIASCFFTCNPTTTESIIDNTPYTWNLPAEFPSPIESADNPTTLAKVALGKRLFYEPMLSENNTISCESCHKQNLAFADDKTISPGVHGRLGLRNSPSLANVGYVPKLNKDGGVPKLDIQALVPIEDENEMNINLEDVVARLNTVESYRSDFLHAFGDEASIYNVPRALAAFLRTMISGHSPYDDYIAGNDNALSLSAQRGAALFFSANLACSSCHNGFNFTNDSFANNGLYLDYGLDPGRQRVTISTDDEGHFRVPSLRNVGLTAPYMHDGSLSTLEAVIDHYNKGGVKHPLQDERIRPLSLSDQEKVDLIAFLEHLTDEDFIQSEAFKP